MTKPKTTKPASPWRSVKDELPEDGAWVLVRLGPEYRMICALYTCEDGWDHEYARDDAIPQPTHWMPIPPLPEDR